MHVRPSAHLDKKNLHLLQVPVTNLFFFKTIHKLFTAFKKPVPLVNCKSIVKNDFIFNVTSENRSKPIQLPASLASGFHSMNIRVGGGGKGGGWGVAGGPKS